MAAEAAVSAQERESRVLQRSVSRRHRRDGFGRQRARSDRDLSDRRLTIKLTVRRPGWAGWLVGRTERHSFTVETPSAHLLGRWLQVKDGAQR